MTQGRKIVLFLGAGASYGAGATAHVQGGGNVLGDFLLNRKDSIALRLLRVLLSAR